MNKIVLYRKNSIGLGTWSIWGEVTSEAEASLHYAHAVTESACEIVHSDTVTVNKSGRGIRDQLDLERSSRIGRQLDKGYKYSREEALAGTTNQLGLVTPMLALPLNRVTAFTFESAHVQPKLDGHRCLITKQDGNVVPYSRRGKLITTIPHIQADFDWLPEGKTVDGELYIHGRKLQEIGSFIKRQQEGSFLLRYHWYDYVGQRAFNHRIQQMRFCVASYRMQSVDLVETHEVASLARAYELYSFFREQGYEGAMLRLSVAGYEDGKRSAQLLKMKERHDCEVVTEGVEVSREGWAVLRVRACGLATQHLLTIEPFRISAPGTVEEKREVLRNYAEKYHGRKLTIEYASITNDGVPFHAVALRWYEEI